MQNTTDSMWAISSIDGRYAKEMLPLRTHVSEAGLNRLRMMVEASWVLHLNDIPEIKPLMQLSQNVNACLKSIEHGDVSESHLRHIKDQEVKTNHDVKAVEYVLRFAMQAEGATDRELSWVHFGCTSEDINNLSYALMLKETRSAVLLPVMDDVITEITKLALKHRDLAMLSRTHGQTATPTTLGKEMAVFVRRLSRQRQRLASQPLEGKMNGAVGNYNAHIAAFPNIDWIDSTKKFVEERLGLAWNPLTTQIETHDTFVEYMEILRLFNMVLLDFCRDMWGYISQGYFAQKTVAGETGSSTMPHKVNPIYFENAEGNIGVGNALLAHFGEKLPVSRFQRDLSDSTVLRVTGTALGHTLLAWKSALKGLSRVEAHPQAIQDDLTVAWEVLGEAVQTVMRRYGVNDAYERLKLATRGQPVVTKDMIHVAIDACSDIPEAVRIELKSLTPETYTGLSGKLVTQFISTSKSSSSKES